MKSIQTKLVTVISAIIIVVVVTFLITATIRTNAILNNDSQDILSNAADYHANIIDDNFRSTEQSVGAIFNYAQTRAEAYPDFVTDPAQEAGYTNDIAILSKSIAENTRGAMAVYLRYNPDLFSPTGGYWFNTTLDNDTWLPAEPTDMSLYEKDDLEHVGWYYIPVAAGEPLWMDPYHNANIGVDMISYIIPFFYGDYTIGIIGMDINMNLLKESVAKVSVYTSGRAFLIDTNGNVIYHEAYPDGESADKLSESDRKYFKDALDLEIDAPVVFDSRDGAEQKLIMKKLKNGMMLGIYVPLDEINAPQHKLLGQQLIISAVILAFAVLIGLIWVKTVTGPLKKMTAVAQHYASGDFSEEMSTKSKDEIGTLSRSLQTMSTSLQEQIQLADSANKAKSDFLANMSHEIRTPINAILGMNEMILRESQENAILDYSFNIQTAGKTLLSIVNTILDFSKIEDGKMEILAANYDTASVVNNLVHSILERAKAKNLDFVVDIDENLPSELYGDDIRITQVIMNLLSNAVKYTEKGTVTFTMREAARYADDIDIFVSVKDTGIGIRKEDLGKLFESFERIEEKRNRSIEGTGLGMAIVGRLLPMMGSKLNVQSVYGEGSEFSFVLRQKIVDTRPIGNYIARLHESESQRGKHTALRAKDAKILVVDDNDMNLKVAKNLMKIYGIMPDLVLSGAEAIERIREKEYDIVFLDHMMPKMDGLETLQELRRQGLIHEHTAVIALTANAIVGAKEMYLEAGFDDYLSKPIEVTALEEQLKRYLPAEKVELVTEEQHEEKPTNEKPAEADDFSALREAGIDTAKGLEYCQNDNAFYRSILKDFESSAESKMSDIRAYYGSGDLKNYAILVHALKSTSKTIGATGLSAMAAELEAAAKNGETDKVHSCHGGMMDVYESTVKVIRGFCSDTGSEDGENGGEGDDGALEFLPE
ncbi:MAG: response regulator [Clostridia bacterium]|nr:response regulator [Clostridia bacterium]